MAPPPFDGNSCTIIWLVRLESNEALKSKGDDSGAVAAQTLQLVDGWLPQGHGRGQGPAPCRRSPAPPVAAPGPDALTWWHRHLMMIDHVVFFITLNPISTRCNLSNDGSLLAIAEFKGFLIPTQWRSLGDGIKRSMPSLSFAYALLIWKSHFSCEVQIKRKSDDWQDSLKSSPNREKKCFIPFQ